MKLVGHVYSLNSSTLILAQLLKRCRLTLDVERYHGNSGRTKTIKAQDSQGYNWYPVEFISEASVDRLDVLPMQNQQFLDEVAGKLEELGLTEVFGLSLLHRSIDERSDDIYVEVTDKAARTLTISMFPKHEIDERFTQTLWHFAPSEKEGIKVKCSGFCRGVSN